jgi:hypothetical protein
MKGSTDKRNDKNFIGTREKLSLKIAIIHEAERRLPADASDSGAR